MTNYTTIDLSTAEGYDNKDRWDYYGDFSYSGHVHYGSPFESDNDCGTCDGAKCDCCHKVHHEPTFLIISYNWLEDEIQKAGFSKEVAEAASSELSDDFGSWPYFECDGKKYRVELPNWYGLDDEIKAKLADELEVDEEFR